MLQLVVILAVFLGVAALVLVMGTVMRGERATISDERFNIITGAATATMGGGTSSSGLMVNLDDSTNAIEAYFVKNYNLKLYLEQADIGFTPAKFLMSTLLLLVGGTVLS